LDEAGGIPLAKAAFTPAGLDGGAAPLVVIVNLTFESPGALAASLGGPRAPDVLGDVAKFTDTQPIAQVSVPV